MPLPLKTLREVSARLGMPEAEIRALVQMSKVRAVLKKTGLMFAPDEIAKIERQRRAFRNRQSRPVPWRQRPSQHRRREKSPPPRSRRQDADGLNATGRLADPTQDRRPACKRNRISAITRGSKLAQPSRGKLPNVPLAADD